MLTIDGSQGEGGGQVLRTSLSLAALTGQDVQIVNIRAGRNRPGLAAQHATCCLAVAAVCNGRVEGVKLDSQTVRLFAGRITGGEYHFDVGEIAPSAGSALLVLQSILPVLAMAPEPSNVTIIGGTDVPWSPPYAYIRDVFAPALGRMGPALRLERAKAGFYPRGGGEITVRVTPSRELAPIDLSARGALEAVEICSTVSEGLPAQIARRQNQAAADAIRRGLRDVPGSRVDIALREDHMPSLSPGTTCAVSLHFATGHAGFTAIGKRGVKAENVGAETGCAAAAFIRQNAAVDEHLADQLLLYAAIAPGRSKYVTSEVTEHLRTNAVVAASITGAEVSVSEAGEVIVEGVGLSREIPWMAR
jgi:RNA 3'-terminal phosphate cyclase (ATP)